MIEMCGNFLQRFVDYIFSNKFGGRRKNWLKMKVKVIIKCEDYSLQTTANKYCEIFKHIICLPSCFFNRFNRLPILIFSKHDNVFINQWISIIGRREIMLAQMSTQKFFSTYVSFKM